MVNIGVLICPKCGSELLYYDTIRRIILTKGREKKKIYIRRLRCIKCRTLHNEIPDLIFPYKRYEAELIRGVLDGIITSNTLGFEDYPCEATMSRWKVSDFSHVLS